MPQHKSGEGERAATSFRLSPQAMANIELIESRTGLSRTAIVEMAVALLAEQFHAVAAQGAGQAKGAG